MGARQLARQPQRRFHLVAQAQLLPRVLQLVAHHLPAQLEAQGAQRFLVRQLRQKITAHQSYLTHDELHGSNTTGVPMKRAIIVATVLSFATATASAKDVPVAPAEYTMFNVYANRGLEKQCAVVTETADLVARFNTLGVKKPDAVLAMIQPPINWQTTAVLLMYQPDPPLDALPNVRSLLKDVNKEKLTLLFRYGNPKENEAPAEVASAAPIKAQPTTPRPVTVRAYTVGTDDVRDRSGFRSPLLLVVVPKFGFLTSKSSIECTQKL